MHIEKNVAATAVGFLLGESDTIAVRKDMEDANCMHHLHLVRDEATSNFVKPAAPYLMTREKKRKEILPAVIRGAL
ncbi:hypothetical protein KC19_VG009000 [Ceratodon purpureus]|uniref:Uncharacterized protein n=1 Tax=Ceratodon purpureus TaxID=3225 RepID=A0A8T0HKT7_CERPU|nr:hypothetical protein KC19_VG009000 [Ceratodon purpureus]